MNETLRYFSVSAYLEAAGWVVVYDGRSRATAGRIAADLAHYRLASSTKIQAKRYSYDCPAVSQLGRVLIAALKAYRAGIA